MDGTARENILMGLPFDAQRYRDIVRACCLEPDFATFLQGDRTIVGDRGVQCSGGQRARLALARALYNDATRAILLDDPLSAVDAHVARTIYHEAIQKLAVKRGKCVVLATHQLQFAGADDDTVCIVLEQGKLVGYGSYANCIAQSEVGSLLSEAMRAGHGGDKDSEVDQASKEENPLADEYVDGGENATKKADLQKDNVFVEKRTTGVIRRSTWLSYGKALGGPIICVSFFLAFSITQAVFLVTITYVGFWAEAPAGEQSTAYWYGIVFGLMAATIICGVLRAQMSYHLFLQASKRMHNQMLHTVLRATVEFYDTNPLGRILNRFAADIGISDDLLPFTIYEFGVGFFMFAGSIITSMAVLPFLLVVFPVLLWAFVRLRNIFILTTRELKRLEGLGRSPIYACLSESMSGIATIRANDKIVYFDSKFEALHDSLIRAQFAFIAVSRWFAMKLDLLSFAFLTAATLSAVVIQDQKWFNLDPAIVGLTLSLMLQLAGSNFPMMVRQSAEVTNHMVSVERIWEFGHRIPQEAPLTTDFDKENEDWPKDTSIVVDSLHARYRKNLPPCLHGVSFSIQPGERVGVVGRTGGLGWGALLSTAIST